MNATSQSQSERGIALIAVLLLLLLSSALSAALAVSASTEAKVARNHQLSAEARAAAEAGLIHAAQLTIANIQNWQANGFADASAAMTALLRGPDNQAGNPPQNADNGSLENLGVARPPTRVQLNGLPGVFYEARLYDEDDPARGLTLSSTDQTRISEDGQAYNDNNGRIVVQAIGYSNGDALARLEATIGSQSLPAIVTNGTLTMSGNPTITGTSGSVHANDDLSLAGSVVISQDATASDGFSTSGNPTVGGTSGGGMPNHTVPNINAADYLGFADFILTSAGTLTTPGGAVLCDASSNQNACKGAYGWVFSGGEWLMNSNSWAAGTYYAQTVVRITGNPGSSANPARISVIAEGSIDVSGNPDLQPDTPAFLFITNGDLEISGGMDTHGGETQILVREQLSLSGNGTYFGQILVQDVPSVSTLVTANSIVGTKVITYNGLSGALSWVISSWRWM